MNSPKTGEKVEGTEIQYGACKFCGQTAPLETVGAVTQEQLDEWATEKCDCVKSKAWAKKKERFKKAQTSICELFPGDSETIRKTLDSVISPIYEGILDKVTIKSGNTTANIHLNSDYDIVIEWIDTRKVKKTN